LEERVIEELVDMVSHGGVGRKGLGGSYSRMIDSRFLKLRLKKRGRGWGGGNFLQPKGQDNLSRGKNILASAQIDRSAAVA